MVRLRALFVGVLVSLLAGGVPAVEASHLTGTAARYTLDADFDEGVLINVNHDDPLDDQLNVPIAPELFPFVAIAVSGNGSIVRIDVNTGQVIGEYWSAPDGMGRDPSRTTVDHRGNVWVGNRAEGGLVGETPRGSVIRIGLIIGGTRVNGDGSANPDGEYLQGPFEHNTCVDRNSDNLIRTSRGSGDIRPWLNTAGVDVDGGVETAEDECITHYVRTRGTFVRTLAVDHNNDVWVGGPGNFEFERLDGDTGTPIAGSEFNVGCGGYGGVLDQNGVLWSPTAWWTNPQYIHVLRYDPSGNGGEGAGECLNIPGNYGAGLDPNTGRVWISQADGTGIFELNDDGSVRNFYNIPGWGGSQGMAVDGNSHVWVAGIFGSAVAHFAPEEPGNPESNHVFVGHVTDMGGTTGIAVDVNDMIWASEYNTGSASRIDPSLGAIGADGVTPIGQRVETVPVGASPYNYSDMTGFVVIAGLRTGTWTVVHDGGVSDIPWHRITWNTEGCGEGGILCEPEGTDITVVARTANSEAELENSAFVLVENGEISGIGRGRYIEVRARLRTGMGGVRPFLTDLGVESFCGDAVLDPLEICDVGEAAGTVDCGCTAACRYEVAGNSCGDVETACSFGDSCDGLGACLENPKPLGTPCGSSAANECDFADQCDGAGSCSQNFAEVGTACGDQGRTECDGPNTCTGLGTCALNFAEIETPCGDQSDSECSNPNRCDGEGSCDPRDEADATLCTDDANFCNGVEVCTRGVCTSPGDPCNPETETCIESDGACVLHCGDGIRDQTEACDDGNTDSLDGCSATCQTEPGYNCAGEIGEDTVCVATCGDGQYADGAEECEDDNTDNDDGCADDCSIEPGWECNLDPETDLSVCETVCGDGDVAGAEACDDGNAESGDGCSDICAIEAGFICDAGEPSICGPLVACGNGALDEGEECDDGDLQNEDGCSSACDVEPGWICDDAEPTACVPDRDHDEVPDAEDNCPSTANTDQADGDEDDIGDVCDPDRDNDTVEDLDDNCPMAANPGQEDLDNDGSGDVCDDDLDGDGIANGDEPATGTRPDDADSDDDGLNDGDEVDRGTFPTDPDTDDGGVPDGEEVAFGTDPTPGHGDDDYDLTGGGAPSACTQAPASELGWAGLAMGVLVIVAIRRRRSLPR